MRNFLGSVDGLTDIIRGDIMDGVTEGKVRAHCQWAFEITQLWNEDSQSIYN